MEVAEEVLVSELIMMIIFIYDNDDCLLLLGSWVSSRGCGGRGVGEATIVSTVHYLKSTNKHVTGDIHFGKTHLTNIVLWSKEGNCPTGGMAQFRILAENRPSIAEHFTY